MAYDPDIGRVVLFSGTGDNDTWTWNGTIWAQLSPTTSPPARVHASMAYDPTSHGLLLFGGKTPGPINDTWTFDGTTWTGQTPTTSPSVRSDAALAATSSQMILFGGMGATAPANGDTWTWTGSDWTELHPANSPVPRWAAATAYNTSSGQLLLYGGFTLDFLSSVVGDTWTWEGTTWAQPASTTMGGAVNAGTRYSASMAYDGGTDQLVLFGGRSNNDYVADTALWGVASGDATMSHPFIVQTGVDATQPFTWSPIASAQAYALEVGTTRYGSDVFVSGLLAPSQTSVPVPALPSSRTLYVTILTKLGGVWGYDATFTSAAGGILSYPLNGNTNIDPTKPFTWSATSGSQGTILVIGTTRFGADVANSGILAPSQTSYNVAAMPTGKTLYASLLTKVAGAWDRYNAIAFTAGPGSDTFTSPVDRQTNVDLTHTFTWSTVAASQGVILVVGTKKFGTDLFNSGALAAGTVSTTIVPTLPPGRTLYATLLTKTNGSFSRYQAISFTTAAS
jgi:hypothetical protein